MAEPIVYPTQDGQEVEIPDLDNLGTVAGLSDDRVLAEILRLTPYDGSNVYKGILPYGFKPQLGAPYPGATVQSTGSANAGLSIGPFRLVIGSRNQAGAAPPGTNPAQNYQPNSLAYWRDVRSGIYIGSSSSASGGVTLAANASGNPRWDLVYATLAVDANGPSQTRRVKNPSTGVVSGVSVPSWLASPVSVTAITGTPGASPALPSIPADSGGNYNAPLCYVWVPNGFGASSTILSKNIRDYATSLSNFTLPGHGFLEPASGCNDRTGTYATNFGWNAASGVRPGPFLPPDMVGTKTIFFEVDALSNPSNWSIPNGGIVDASVDWRNRFFRVDYQSATAAFGSAKLASDPAGGTAGTTNIPIPQAAGATGYVAGSQLSSSFKNANDTFSTGNPAVCYFIAGAGLSAGLWVDSTTGALKFYGTGATTISLMYFMVTASAPMPNY